MKVNIVQMYTGSFSCWTSELCSLTFRWTQNKLHTLSFSLRQIFFSLIFRKLSNFPLSFSLWKRCFTLEIESSCLFSWRGNYKTLSLCRPIQQTHTSACAGGVWVSLWMNSLSLLSGSDRSCSACQEATSWFYKVKLFQAVDWNMLRWRILIHCDAFTRSRRLNAASTDSVWIHVSEHQSTVSLLSCFSPCVTWKEEEEPLWRLWNVNVLNVWVMVTVMRLCECRCATGCVWFLVLALTSLQRGGWSCDLSPARPAGSRWRRRRLCRPHKPSAAVFTLKT